MVIEAGAPVLRFESEAEWHDRARGQQRRLATLDAPGALTMVGDAVAPGRGQGLGVLVLRFEPARALESRLSPASAASLAVDLAGLVETHRRAGGTDVLGPYDPALVVQTDAGLRVVAPGFARLVQRHDAGIRGISTAPASRTSA